MRTDNISPQPHTSNPPERSPLRGRRVAFTGRLATMSRAAAHEHVRRLGGEVVASVSRRTSLLVVGMRGWPLLGSGAVSRQLRRGEELAARGARLRIVSEAEFREIVGLDPREASEGKAYNAEQIAAMTGVDPLTLRRWEQLSLVRSRDGRYDFRDIVSLRTIADLVSRGVRPEVIASSLHALARVLPGTERPLAQLRLIAAGSGDLLAEIGSGLIGKDGQLRLNFDAPEQPALPAGPLASRLPGGAPGQAGLGGAACEPSAEQWFERGLQYEEEEHFAEAAEAYRQAIALRRDFAEAHFNLGNALRELERFDEAAAAYRAAGTLDPELAEAWYNLADVAEQQGRVGEAVEHLRRALTVDPEYADAHFNLAACYQQLGRFDEAARHWRAYLRLDPASEWSRAALAQIRR